MVRSYDRSFRLPGGGALANSDQADPEQKQRTRFRDRREIADEDGNAEIIVE